jgi:hypothetical protein
LLVLGSERCRIVTASSCAIVMGGLIDIFTCMFMKHCVYILLISMLFFLHIFYD